MYYFSFLFVTLLYFLNQTHLLNVVDAIINALVDRLVIPIAKPLVVIGIIFFITNGIDWQAGGKLVPCSAVEAFMKAWDVGTKEYKKVIIECKSRPKSKPKKSPLKDIQVTPSSLYSPISVLSSASTILSNLGSSSTQSDNKDDDSNDNNSENEDASSTASWLSTKKDLNQQWETSTISTVITDSEELVHSRKKRDLRSLSPITVDT